MPDLSQDQVQQLHQDVQQIQQQGGGFQQLVHHLVDKFDYAVHEAHEEIRLGFPVFQTLEQDVESFLHLTPAVDEPNASNDNPDPAAQVVTPSQTNPTGGDINGGQAQTTETENQGKDEPQT